LELSSGASSRQLVEHNEPAVVSTARSSRTARRQGDASAPSSVPTTGLPQAPAGPMATSTPRGQQPPTKQRPQQQQQRRRPRPSCGWPSRQPGTRAPPSRSRQVGSPLGRSGLGLGLRGVEGEVPQVPVQSHVAELLPARPHRRKELCTLFAIFGDFGQVWEFFQVGGQ